MKRSKHLFLIAAVLLIVGFIFLGRVWQKSAMAEKDYFKELELFTDAISVIETDYVDADNLEPKKLIYGALKGMMSQLDPYSQFMEPDEFKEMKQETEGKFGGLGIEIMIKDGLLTIIAPLCGGPAEKAGIIAGDRIVKIGGISTKDIKLNEAVKKLRGKPGTNVELTILRETEKKVLDFKIKRALIKIESVKEVNIIDKVGKIGYIRLAEFQENTPVDLDAALAKLKSQGMQAFILDLRNNPGGLLDIAAAVSERFIPEGKIIVSTKGRVPNQDIVLESHGKNLYTDFPMIVLVNKGSASASEIVAGALQDHKRAVILGTKTFGKGSVQTVVPLSDGSALRLTTAKYYTPNNKMIHAEGISPDVTVEQKNLSSDEQELDIFDDIKEKQQPVIEKKFDDVQLARAIDLLKAMKIYKNLKDSK